MGREANLVQTASQRGIISRLGLTGCDFHRVLLSYQISWLQVSHFRHEGLDIRQLGCPCVRGRVVARRITYSKTMKVTL